MARFGNDYPWRFVVTDLQLATTTWADGLFSSRLITLNGNQASTIEANVDPDDFRVNGLWTDGYPRVAQSNRIVFGYRREGGHPPWKVRCAGILMSPDDEADTEVPTTRLVAYDPWKYLEARPATKADGSLPGAQGITPLSATGDQIALEFLKNTILNEGGVFIDAGPDYGGTAEWAGTIETTAAIDIVVQQGQSVADVWSSLCDAGNLDIVLKPIYDPTRTIVVDGITYYFTHELSIYNLAGQDRPNAPFAWDMMQRNVARIERMHDGTPGAFFNKVQYYAGQGGPPVPASGPLVNAASVAAFYSYWAQQFWPSYTSTDPTGAAVLELAAQSLVLAKQGRRTITIDAISGRAPVPLLDYDVFDFVPVWATRRLRAAISTSFATDPPDAFRVETIPLSISDDGVEEVTGLVVSPDFRQAGS